MTDLVLKSLYETFTMVGVSSIFSVILGIPLAILLVTSRPGGLAPHPLLFQTLNLLVNATRSIPYIILTVLLMPVTRWLVGTSIGTMAAIIPLTLAGLLLIARVTEDALRVVPHGLLEVGLAGGARRSQIITKILLPEAFPHIISGITTVVINLIGFSAMAGAVGGGGLGDLAIRYGYQRYDVALMTLIVVILIIIVQIVQSFGTWLTHKLTK
jgi:D-methionine transport system permease protein